MSIPSFMSYHDSEKDAFNYRIQLIRNLITHFRSCCDIRLIALDILHKLPADTPRGFYDFAISRIIYNWMLKNVPYRRDIHNVETIQYPEITLRYGGDCDDMVVLAGALLETAGVQVKLIVSSFSDGNSWDHISLLIPGDIVFDLQFPGKMLTTLDIYPKYQIIGGE